MSFLGFKAGPRFTLLGVFGKVSGSGRLVGSPPSLDMKVCNLAGRKWVFIMVISMH